MALNVLAQSEAIAGSTSTPSENPGLLATERGRETTGKEANLPNESTRGENESAAAVSHQATAAADPHLSGLADDFFAITNSHNSLSATYPVRIATAEYRKTCMQGITTPGPWVPQAVLSPGR